MRLIVYDMLVNVNVIYYVHVCEQARWARSAGNSAIENLCIIIIIITVEVEPRIAKQYKCHHCCSCRNYHGKRMEGVEKRCFCVVFWLTRRSGVRRKKSVLGHPIARAASYYLLPDTLWLRSSKNAFKVGSVKFANSLSPLPLWRNYAPEVKAAKGLKRCQAKVKGVNNPARIAQ